MITRIFIMLSTMAFINCTQKEGVIPQDLYLTSGEVKLVEGNYTGTLEYLDYSDDQRKVSLNMTATYTLEGNKLKIVNQYDEGNGKMVTRKGNYKIKDGLIDGNALTEKVVTEEAIKIVWLNMGTDGNANKKATFRFTIESNGETLQIKKEVKYAGEANYFTRNLTTLKRA